LVFTSDVSTFLKPLGLKSFDGAFRAFADLKLAQERVAVLALFHEK